MTGSRSRSRPVAILGDSHQSISQDVVGHDSETPDFLRGLADVRLQQTQDGGKAVIKGTADTNSELLSPHFGSSLACQNLHPAPLQQAI